MCIYIYIYVCVCVYIYTCVYIYIYIIIISIIVTISAVTIYIYNMYVYLYAHILKHEKNMNPSSSCWFSGVQASNPAPAVSFLRLNDGQGASDQQRRPGIRWTQRQPRQNVVPLLSRSHEVGPGLQLGEHNSNNYT